MKILLYKPFFHDIAVMPPMGLCYIAAILEKNKIPVEILDNTLLHLSSNELGSKIAKGNYDIIGIYSSTPMIKQALQDAQLFKEVSPNTYISLGGPHPSATIEEILSSSSYIDSICVGEGEFSFLELVKRFVRKQDTKEIQGFAFKVSGGIKINLPPNFIENLDSLPFPAFHLLPIEKYFARGNNYGILQREVRNLPIITSRGCPGCCTFCQRFLGNKFRKRSPQNIADELELHSKKYNVHEFNFLDDNFIIDNDWAIGVCKEIKKRNLKIRFRFPNGVREDMLNEGLLLELKSVGCYHLDFGIESGCQKVLNIMKKGKRLERIREKVWLAHKIGFELSATFIFGTPGETKEDMLKTIDFALSLPLDSASFGIVIPFPGTELRKEVIEKNFLVHSNYENYNPGCIEDQPAIETPDWNGEDLKKILKLAYRKFFFRPRYFLKSIPKIFLGENRRKYFDALKFVLSKK